MKRSTKASLACWGLAAILIYAAISILFLGEGGRASTSGSLFNYPGVERLFGLIPGVLGAAAVWAGFKVRQMTDLDAPED